MSDEINKKIAKDFGLDNMDSREQEEMVEKIGNLLFESVVERGGWLVVSLSLTLRTTELPMAPAGRPKVVLGPVSLIKPLRMLAAITKKSLVSSSQRCRGSTR